MATIPPQTTPVPTTTDKVFDAAATIGRVSSYFQIAGSTIVLTLGGKGFVFLREQNRFPRVRGNLATHAPPAVDRHAQGIGLA